MTVETEVQENEIREPSMVDALIPLLFMILLLITSIVLFGLDVATGPLQVALFVIAVMAAIVSLVVAFWFLVPGTRGLLSITSNSSADIQRAGIGLVQVVILIKAISMGVLLGTLLVSPGKFVPITALSDQPNLLRG